MESFDYTPICNFCSREISQVERMIAGEECHVCNYCIDALHDIVHSPLKHMADQGAQRVARLEFYRGRDDRH